MPIELCVLDEHDGMKLLLSKCALDCRPYNDEDADVTWEGCALRARLNSEFLAAALT